MPNKCPLCKSSAKIFYQSKKRLYHQCKTCKGIFVDERLIPDFETEKKRYLEHNNDINNSGYQKFVSPITSAILNNFTTTDTGLDFGAGTGPVISKILRDNHYSIELYDPFFHDNKDLLNNKFNYIACCEVIEHFHFPEKEFQLLKRLLKPGGKLYCMTSIYNDQINFHTWFYKNDITHVFIYQKETLEWIQKEIGFSKITFDENLIVFVN